jgi:hypothetical protein
MLSAKAAAEAGQYDDAWRILDQAAMLDPENAHVMVLASFLTEKQKRPGLSYHIARRMTELYPQEASGWVNYGRACDTLWHMDEAIRAYKMALQTNENKSLRLICLVNISAAMLQLGRWTEALEWAQQAVDLNPENKKARHNIGMAQLALHQWGNAWANYSASVATDQRVLHQYNAETRYAGERGGTLVLVGEQGLGDELNAASMVPDMADRVDRLIVDCDDRLEGLFRRSFADNPKVAVYGTRRHRSPAKWLPTDRTPTYATVACQAGEWTRLNDDAFPRKTFLKADPDRVLMWRALWDSEHAKAGKKRPVIGIAWSGGVMITAGKYRIWPLESLLSVFQSQPDAIWVSLQYRDAADEIESFRKAHPEVDIRQYRHGTLTSDYDDTAALVESLDCVFTMQTALVHLCGGLGKTAFVGVCHANQWRYSEGSNKMIWYGDWVTLYRQARQSHEWPFEQMIGDMREYLDNGRLPATERDAAPAISGVRDGEPALREGGGADDEQQSCGGVAGLRGGEDEPREGDLGGAAGGPPVQVHPIRTGRSKVRHAA